MELQMIIGENDNVNLNDIGGKKKEWEEEENPEVVGILTLNMGLSILSGATSALRIDFTRTISTQSKNELYLFRYLVGDDEKGSEKNLYGELVFLDDNVIIGKFVLNRVQVVGHELAEDEGALGPVESVSLSTSKWTYNNAKNSPITKEKVVLARGVTDEEKEHA